MAVVLLTLAASAPSPVRALDRVEVASATPGDVEMTRVVAEVLAEDHVVVEASPEDTVMQGTLRVTVRGRRRGGRWVIVMRVEAADGTAQQGRVRVRNATQLRRRALRELRPVLRRVWARAEHAPVPETASREPDAPPARAVMEDASEASEGSSAAPGPAAPDSSPAASASPGTDAAARPSPGASEPERAASRARPSAVTLSLGAGVLHRSLALEGDPAVRGYSLPGAPAWGLVFRFFPLALAGGGWPAHLGLELRASQAFALETGEPSHPTHAHAWQAGIRGRVPIDVHQLALGAAWGEQRFAIDPAGPQRPGGEALSALPSVRYRFVRAFVGFTAELPGPLFVAGEVGWRGIHDLGPLGDVFGDVFAQGIDGSLTIGLQATDWLAFVARGSWNGAFASFEPSSERASGLRDHYLAARLELEIRDPGWK